MPSGIYKRKPFSEKHKRRISEGHKGIKRQSPTTKTKEKIRQSLSGKKQSEERKKKISLAHKGMKKPWAKGFPYGKKHPNWQGGISLGVYSTDWTETLKRSIRERDNYICQLCSQYGNAVHHIDYDKKNCAPKNLITLCRGCNAKVNKNREHWTNYFNLL